MLMLMFLTSMEKFVYSHVLYNISSSLIFPLILLPQTRSLPITFITRETRTAKSASDLSSMVCRQVDSVSLMSRNKRNIKAGM